MKKIKIPKIILMINLKITYKHKVIINSFNMKIQMKKSFSKIKM